MGAYRLSRNNRGLATILGEHAVSTVHSGFALVAEPSPPHVNATHAISYENISRPQLDHDPSAAGRMAIARADRQ
jgi:hypothetical protein